MLHRYCEQSQIHCRANIAHRDAESLFINLKEVEVMETKPHGLQRKICQNCRHYKRPRCLIKGLGLEKEFVRRKDSCGKFENKREKI